MELTNDLLMLYRLNPSSCRGCELGDGRKLLPKPALLRSKVLQEDAHFLVLSSQTTEVLSRDNEVPDCPEQDL